MSSTELTSLAKRAVACSKWVWLPGMQVICAPTHETLSTCLVRVDGEKWVSSPTDLPNLNDGCTLGGVLMLVRRAWSDSTAHVSPIEVAENLWCLTVKTKTGHTWFYGKTEAEAMTVALEMAG